MVRHWGMWNGLIDSPCHPLTNSPNPCRSTFPPLTITPTRLPVIERYFREQATQDVRRRVTACIVAVGAKALSVAGYYTLAAASVPLPDIPATLAKKLHRYPSEPVAHFGRSAVASDIQGRRLGGMGRNFLVDGGQRIKNHRPQRANYTCVHAMGKRKLGSKGYKISVNASATLATAAWLSSTVHPACRSKVPKLTVNGIYPRL